MIYHSKTDIKGRSSASLFMEWGRAMKSHLEWSSLQKQKSPKQACSQGSTDINIFQGLKSCSRKSLAWLNLRKTFQHLATFFLYILILQQRIFLSEQKKIIFVPFFKRQSNLFFAWIRNCLHNLPQIKFEVTVICF